MAGNSELEIKLAVSDMRLFDIILSDPQMWNCHREMSPKREILKRCLL